MVIISSRRRIGNDFEYLEKLEAEGKADEFLLKQWYPNAYEGWMDGWIEEERKKTLCCTTLEEDREGSIHMY